MRKKLACLLMSVVGLGVACSDAPPPPEPTPEPLPEVRSPTPPEVEQAFQALKANLDADRPGESVQRLQGFLDDNRGYEIAEVAQAEIDAVRLVARGRYHEARELARQGEFERAEIILEDLASHLEDTTDGEAAREHLQFDFHFGRAQWLLVRQRFSESTDVARPLLKRDLTPMQMHQVETLLDQVGHVGEALSLAQRQAALAGVRQLFMFLAHYYVEEGRYPSRLSITDVDELGGFGNQSIRRALSEIQDYRPTRDSYSFVAVSAEGRHRVRVVDGTIQN